MTSNLQSRALMEDSCYRICSRVSSNIQNVDHLCRQMLKGSRTNDILSMAAKNMAGCETQFASSEINLNKMMMTTKHFNQQLHQIGTQLDVFGRKQAFRNDDDGDDDNDDDDLN